PRQRPLRAVADDNEMRADFFGNFGDFLPGIADLKPCGRRKSQRLQPLGAFVQDGLVILGLQLDRYREPGLGRHDRGNLDDGEQKVLGTAELCELCALPQRAPPFDRTVIGEKNLLIHRTSPSMARRAKTTTNW